MYWNQAIAGESATLASGIMNSLSAGILLYTALVELMVRLTSATLRESHV